MISHALYIILQHVSACSRLSTPVLAPRRADVPLRLATRRALPCHRKPRCACGMSWYTTTNPPFALLCASSLAPSPHPSHPPHHHHPLNPCSFAPTWRVHHASTTPTGDNTLRPLSNMVALGQTTKGLQDALSYASVDVAADRDADADVDGPYSA